MTLDRGNLMLVTMAALLAAGAAALAPAGLRAETGPDELYRQGRFEEAEKAYGRLDMDRPRDLRYRYNRGCAAFEKGDDEAATAAFTSVLRRADDEEMRFRAAFNLGNIAFRQEDFGTAADWYRRALLFRPVSGDARHNLELALREAEKEKEKEQEQEQESPQDGDEGDGEGKEGEGKEGEDGKEGESEGTPSPGEGEEEENADSETGEPDEESGREGEDESGQDGENREGEGESKPAEPSGEEQDLTGELSPAGEELPPVEEGEEGEGPAPGIDRNKAEALLDNIREDRTRFLRLQVPEDKRRGVESGKDW